MSNKSAAIISLSLLAFLTVTTLQAADEQLKPIFNGNDLTGWVNVNCAPETFTVDDNMIVCTGVPTGVIRTERQYENFILELEWKHLKPKGNAGLFVWSNPLTARGVPFTRSIEIQILDGHETENYTSHGDIFSIHGSTMKPDRPHPAGWMRCLPSEKRCKPAGQWNHYRVECHDGSIKLAVNGKVVSGASDCLYRKGYICLESEGSPVHFRNIKLKELPSTNATKKETADSAKPFKPIYTGLDLEGWKENPQNKNHWQAKNWTLNYDGKSKAEDKNLWTKKSYSDFVMIVDWRLTGKPKKVKYPAFLGNGQYEFDTKGNRKQYEVDDAGSSGISLRGSLAHTINLWCLPNGSGSVSNIQGDKERTVPDHHSYVKADNPTGQWNRFIITLKRDRLTVLLNDRIVLEEAILARIPPKGPIALIGMNDSVQFANLFIRDLDQEQAAEKKLIEKLKTLGAAVKYADIQVQEIVSDAPVRASPYLTSIRTRQELSYVLLGSNWKGGQEGFQLLRQLTQLPTLYVMGDAMSKEEMTRLQYFLPELKIQRRDYAYLGIAARAHPPGCRIFVVKEGTAADKAGLQVGDIITNIDGSPIKDFDQVINLIADKKPADVLKIEILRVGEKKTLTVTLGEWK